MAAVSLTTIEQAVVARFKTQGLEARMIAIQKGTTGIQKPAVYVSINAGKFDRVAQGFKQTVTVSVYLDFPNLASEAARREGLYPILEAVIAMLAGQKLGLQITELVPKAFENVTTKDDAVQGRIAYQADFETSFTVQPTPEAEATEWLRQGLNYYLTVRDDDTVDASDLVTLRTP